MFPPPVPRRFWGGLVLVFIGLTAVLALTGYSYDRHQTARQLEAARKELSTIAELKAGQIENWYLDRLNNVQIVLANPFIQKGIVQFLTDPNSPEPAQNMATWADNHAKLKHCQVFLYDARGTLRLSAPQNVATPEVSGDPDFQAVLRGHDVVTTDLHRDPGTAVDARQGIYLSFWIPVGGDAGASGTAVGALEVRINPYELLYPLVQSWPARTLTAETLLVRREGNEVVYLNELRHRENTALNLRFPMGQNMNLPAVSAVQGREGVVEGRDYRQVPVLAALRKIPGTPWFMVAKVDMDEVREPVRRQTLNTVLVFSALILAAALGVGFLGRRRDNLWLRRQLAMEHERQALAERYVLLNKHANDIILLTDQDGNILEANDKALAAYGRSIKEMKSMTLRDLRCAETGGEHAGAVHGAAPHDGVMVETVHRRRDGSVFPVEASTHAMTVGGVTFHQSIIRDVTERKRAESDLARANQELSRKNQELEQVVYVASHDLRSPLVNVQGFSTELGMALDELRHVLDGVELPGEARTRLNYLLDDDAAESIRYILSGIAKMDMLIAGLLRLSRLGRVTLSVGPVDMNQLAADTAADFEFQIKDSGVDLTIGDLPPCLGDAAQLGRVFSNLLGNALKYLDPSRPGMVRITGVRADGQSVYCIEDNGIGIAEQHQKKIFDLYHRLNPDDSAGEGLGLTIVRTVLDRQHGRVWVESVPGAGARFYVVLPAAGETGTGKESA